MLKTNELKEMPDLVHLSAFESVFQSLMPFQCPKFRTSDHISVLGSDK